MTVISLTTDFGSGDHEAGVLKGVIWNIAPRAHITDLSHEIPPHQIMEAALLLRRATQYFPDGSIHVAVVDPGVGTSRRGIAAHVDSQFFVGPDNGIVSLLLDQAEDNQKLTAVIHLDRPEYWLQEVSSVFHGRDIFAPIAGHLAAGVPLNMLGSPMHDPIRIKLPKASRTGGGWLGQVIHIDHFGNLSTNLNRNHLKELREIRVHIKGVEIEGLVNTFGERPKGSLIALLDSGGSLAISVVNGNAAHELSATVGDMVEVSNK